MHHLDLPLTQEDRLMVDPVVKLNIWQRKINELWPLYAYPIWNLWGEARMTLEEGIGLSLINFVMSSTSFSCKIWWGAHNSAVQSLQSSWHLRNLSCIASCCLELVLGDAVAKTVSFQKCGDKNSLGAESARLCSCHPWRLSNHAILMLLSDSNKDQCH
jgi:hypothetical protein